MYPPYRVPALSSHIKARDINFIIIPDVGARRELEEDTASQLVEACLKSTRRYDRGILPLYGGSESFFPAGSWCANALLASPTNSQVSLFLARHRRPTQQAPYFDHKVIAGVHIVKLDHHPGSNPLPSLVWEIIDQFNEYAQCAKQWGRVPLGQPLPRYQATTILGSETPAGVQVPAICYPQHMRSWPAAATASNAPEQEGRPIDLFGVQSTQHNRPSNQAATDTGEGMSASEPGQHANDPLRMIGIPLDTDQHQAQPQGQAPSQRQA